MSGGRHIALGPAIAFAGLSIVGEGALAWFILRANRRIGSEFIALDAKNWVIAASMSACYLLAFLGGVLVQGTSGPGSGRTSTRPSLPSSACW